jgi:hypothetical protein
MRSKTVRFWQYTAYSEKKRNFVLSANMQSEIKHFLPKPWRETVQFWRQRDIHENMIM